MPYQVLPGMIIISVGFTAMGLGLGAVNKWQARNEMQTKLVSITDFDRMMYARDRKFAKLAKEREILEAEAAV